MLPWTIELSEYGIKYQSRLSMKGQVMTDFIVEVPQQPTQSMEFFRAGWWILQVDGASWLSESRVGLLLKSPTGEQLEQSGLNLALALFASKLRIYNDSQLIVGHIQKEYKAKHERMSQYLMKVQDSLQQLDEWAVEKIPQADKMQVDALAGIVASLPIRESILLPIYVQTAPSITESLVCNTIEESQDWTSAIKTYLWTGTLSKDSKHARYNIKNKLFFFYKNLH